MKVKTFTEFLNTRNDISDRPSCFDVRIYQNRDFYSKHHSTPGRAPDGKLGTTLLPWQLQSKHVTRARDHNHCLATAVNTRVFYKKGSRHLTQERERSAVLSSLY